MFSFGVDWISVHAHFILCFEWSILLWDLKNWLFPPEKGMVWQNNLNERNIFCRIKSVGLKNPWFAIFFPFLPFLCLRQQIFSVILPIASSWLHANDPNFNSSWCEWVSGATLLVNRPILCRKVKMLHKQPKRQNLPLHCPNRLFLLFVFAYQKRNSQNVFVLCILKPFEFHIICWYIC